jgi:2,4-dienoyl-CoA reductase-like NADH-dependent reductase (Old Yellow Enzyme family)
MVSGNARNHCASLCIFDDRFMPRLADLTKAIHHAGALACGQLNHRGMLLRTFRACRGGLTMSALKGRTDMSHKRGHFCS